MDVPPTLPEQLRSLGREVVAVVPSCVAVAIVVRRLGVDVGITLSPTGAVMPPRAAEVLSSLALPLPGAGQDCTLVLQAWAPGAFVLLAEELAALPGGRPPPELDAHRSPGAVPTGEALAGALAELGRLDRALGVLIDHGWPPEAAEAELHRRAAVAGWTVAAAAERLLASPSPGARHEPD